MLVNLFQGYWRTVLGSNLGRIRLEMGGGPLTPGTVKKNLKYCQATPEQEWRISAVLELLEVREGSRTVDAFSASEVTHLIELLCSG